MVLRGKTFTFGIVQERYDWAHLIAAQNPSGSGAQDLYGTCEETYPSCIDSGAHPVEKALGVRSKPFQRTISDEVGNNSPDHIRTKQAICKAMQQLVALVDTDRSDIATSEVSSYIHNRFRAIRQEMELQHIRSLLTAKLLEPMIRLMAIKAHEMCQDKDYSAALVMDRKELAKMFVSLKALYTAHRQVGQKLPTEAEFTSYLILFKAEQDVQTAMRDGVAVLLLNTPEDIVSDPRVRWALAVVDAIQQFNYVQFVKLLQTSTYVQACFLHMLFLDVARDSQMGAMKEAFKLKVFPLSKLQEIMLLDTEEQVRAWLMREGADVVVTGDGQDAEATFPAKAWPRGKGLTVSEQILRKRNGSSTSGIITSVLTSDGSQAPSTALAPIPAMFTFPSQPQTRSPPSQQGQFQSPQFQSPQQVQVRPAAQVAEPDLARAASEHQAAKHAAEQLAVEHKAVEQAAAEKAAMDQAAQEKAAAEQVAAEKEAAKQAVEAAERKAAEEREAAKQAAAERAAQQAAAAEAKKRAVEEAAQLEALRQQDAAFCRAGQNLEERERQAWAAEDVEYASNVAYTSQLRKRHREHVAHIEAEEQAAAEVQRQVDRRKVVQACSFHTPPSETWRRLQEQASRDRQQAAGVRDLMVTSLALSMLDLRSAGPLVELENPAASPVGVIGGGVGRVGRQPSLLVQHGVGALEKCAHTTIPLSPDSQPVLRRPKVSAMRNDNLVYAARESARFHAAEARGGDNTETNEIPVVSKILSVLNRGR